MRTGVEVRVKAILYLRTRGCHKGGCVVPESRGKCCECWEVLMDLLKPEDAGGASRESPGKKEVCRASTLSRYELVRTKVRCDNGHFEKA